MQFRRKHTFDAGATPGLDDVDRPDLKAIDADLVDELEDISEQHERRQDRIAELEARLDKKDGRITELEDELEDARDLQRLGEAFVDAAQGSDGGGVETEQHELLEEKNATIAELRERVTDLEAETDALREERDDLEAEVERLQGIEARVERAEEIETMLEEVRDVVGVEIKASATPAPSDGLVEEYDEAREEAQDLRGRLQDAHERIDALEAENERLREQGGDGVTVPTDYQDFVDEPVVQKAIEEAKEKTSASPRYVRGVVATIIQEGSPVDYETVADRLGVKGTSDVSKAASTLEALGVLKRVQQSPALIDFDLDGVAEIKEAQQRREQAEAVMDEL
ncbi:hypothetical protein ACFQL0_21180 [Haloplanus litoreus]|uniref:hypothetical protein n=1 Tax=Haloplanus litoreus TaxID=767515 RepID=UPI00360AB855